MENSSVYYYFFGASYSKAPAPFSGTPSHLLDLFADPGKLVVVPVLFST
jgi:hypothetical protein